MGPDSDRTASKRLEKLVATRNYDEAAKLCRAALSETRNPLYWETQLGYVLFLNEEDAEKYYVQTPKVFNPL